MKKIKWIGIIVIVLVTGIATWYWKFRPENPKIVLTTEIPRYGTISNAVTATGTVQPVDTVAVGTQVSGRIKKVYVDFNSPVKKGQLLAEIDKSILLAQVQQSNASVQQAEANLVYQKSNFDRQTQLYNVGAVSKADLETALYQYNAAKENLNSAKAALSSAQKNLSYADIYSPIDGTILSRSISEGQTVAASFSTPTLFSIAKDLKKMQVQASVDEADIGNVAPGERVLFTVDAFPDDTFSGTVKEIRLKATTTSNVVTYTTIVEAPNNGMKLKPGMTANITIYVREVGNAMLISSRALNFHPDSELRKIYRIRLEQSTPATDTAVKKTGAFKGTVWLKKDSNIIGRAVETGLNDDNYVEILRGLENNDIVITGYTQNNKGAPSGTTNASPFMPRHPGTSTRRTQ